MADNLPRPEPLRSWYALYGDALWGRPPVVSDEAGFELVVEDEMTRRAIAALPERIRRMDAVRAYCTQVQAAHPVPDPWVVVFDVLRLLDGEGVS